MSVDAVPVEDDVVLKEACIAWPQSVRSSDEAHLMLEALGLHSSGTRHEVPICHFVASQDGDDALRTAFELGKFHVPTWSWEVWDWLLRSMDVAF